MGNQSTSNLECGGLFMGKNLVKFLFQFVPVGKGKNS